MRDLVTRYYKAVDADDVPGLLLLFAEDAEYHRPGYAPLLGREALRRFYTDERVIAEGHHTVYGLVESPGEIAVRGAFSGTSRSGAPLALEFADFFKGQDVITWRQTYFYAPLV